MAPVERGAHSEWIADAADAGVRLGTFVGRRALLGSRAIRRALERGACAVNGRRETFPSRRLSPGDRVRFTPPAEAPTPPSLGPERVLFETKRFLVMDKPPGIPAVGTDRGGPGNARSLLAQALRKRLFPVHRLDLDTSGCLAFALDEEAAAALEALFREREVKKTYEAILDGVVTEDRGALAGRMDRADAGDGREKWAMVPRGGKPVETAFETIARYPSASRVRLFPRTGRTHQLRVQTAHWGHPVLGDVFYAKSFRCPARPARHLLHALCLEFIDPFTGGPVRARSPLPPDMDREFS